MRKFFFEKRKYGFELLMDVHTFENNPNVFFESDPHTCDFFEIMIFEKASGTMDLNGQLLEVAENSIFFICPFQKKSCKIPLEDIKGFHLVFQNNFLSDFFDDKLFAYRLQYFYNSQQPQYLQLKDEEYDIIRFALKEIIAEINHYHNDSSHIIRSLLYFSLSKLNRFYSTFYNISPDTQSDTRIHKFKELLELNIRNTHSVNNYCEMLQLNRHKLNKLVKEHTGHSSKEIINNRLLQEVKRELRYSAKTIAEIAYDLNFSEPNNLTRFFRKMEGVSPVAYRKSAQNDSF